MSKKKANLAWIAEYVIILVFSCGILNPLDKYMDTF